MLNRAATSLGSQCLAVAIAITSLAVPTTAAADCVDDADRIAAIEDYLADTPDPFPIMEFLLDFFASRYADECVHLNEIQVLGTHNSYHVQPSDALYDFMYSVTPVVEAWQYSHLPVAEQLGSQGVRQFELDIYPDADGLRFFFRLGPLLVGENPFGPLSLLIPGMKVLHIPHLDFETTCGSLVACLQQLKAWSDANPAHLPVMVLVETKGDEFEEPDPVVEAVLGAAEQPVPFGPAEFDALDAEIRSVFSEDVLFTPDDLRGNHATLEEVVLGEGWPTLGSLRGQVFFAMDQGGAQRLVYLEGHPSLEGRVMFTNSSRGQPDAAFIKVNDPLANQTQIHDLVQDGYLVRTRADTDTEEARSGDTERRESALASGAQFVSTDFPVASTNPGFSDYFVEIPDGSPARCNPVASPAGCRNDALEDLP